jgi:SAM-dependent methyltransferase
VTGSMGERHYALEARFYDALYEDRGRDVGREVAMVEAVLADLDVAPRSVLDVACGTGAHLEVWARRGLDVAGSDLVPEMLAVARERLPDGTPLVEADFRSLDLGRTFDLVTCMFSAIGHAGREGVDAAIAAMARHVAPGGALVIEPWLTPDRVRPGGMRDVVAAWVGDAVMSRVARSWLEGDDLLLEFGWTTATPDGIDFHAETLAMPLLTQDRYVAGVAATGLDASWVDEHGWGAKRGLVVGVRR